MATFLTTKKMSPELVARIETTLRGGRAKSKRWTPGRIALVRFAAIASVIGLVVWGVTSFRHHNAEIEEKRAQLRSVVRAETSNVTSDDLETIGRVEAWCRNHSGDYAGDVITRELHGPDALASALARPTIYLRGPIEDFDPQTGPYEIAQASFRDAFILCALDPPAQRVESTLRQRARAARSGKGTSGKGERIELLSSAHSGARFLTPEWAKQVEEAANLAELGHLEAAFHRAPIEAAKRSLKARQLLVVMDEKKIGNGPTEIDGACPHYARVTLVEFETDHVLLRTRKLIDPAWLSDDARITDASGVNACELGMAVHADTVAPAP